MTIRPYEAQDFGALVALWQACGLNHPHNDPARDLPLMAGSANATLPVLVEDGQIVGSIFAGHDAHRGWLYRLAVAPDRRRRGHGRRLVRHAERWLAEQDIRKAQLMIRETNAAVRDFYLRLGYRVEDRIVMSRWIEPGAEAANPRIPVVITYLRMTEPPTRPPTPPPPGKLALLRADRPPVAFYRYLYNGVGEPWFWIDRRRLDDAALAKIVHDPRVDIYVLYVGGVPAGYAELDRRREEEITLAYFGLMPDFLGRGLGSFLLDWAVDTAWQHRPRRLLVDTCTLDHPRALAVYQRAGFAPYRQERKEIDDPRLAGLIPAHLEPRLP